MKIYGIKEKCLGLAFYADFENKDLVMLIGLWSITIEFHK